MRARVTILVALSAAAACAPGTSSPPALAYRLPDPTSVAYAAADTMTVGISALGQSLTLGVKVAARYGVDFERADDGVRVTLGVEDLAAEVDVPMSGPIQLDKSIVSGDLVFALDRRGKVTVLSSPQLASSGGQLLSPLRIAHSLFPGLPGTAVAAGDTWVDTVSVDESGETGRASERSIFVYTVVGEAQVDGRSLLEITFVGTSQVEQETTLQGAHISQTSQLEVHGRILWDTRRNLVYEREATTSGTGSAKIAALPSAFPTTLASHSVARLQVDR
jgi:hypothetical protein